MEARDNAFDVIVKSAECGAVEDDVDELMRRWRGREVSNFDYLMQLNIIADRSFNDLTQCVSTPPHLTMRYPVMPWVLADYTSDTLGHPPLRNVRPHRLNKPGDVSGLFQADGSAEPEPPGFIQGRCIAVPLTRSRGATTRCRSRNSSLARTTPLRGTSCSSSSAKVNTAAKLLTGSAPELLLRLQNGKFDAPDRMFSSIADAWTSATNNPADVKELIPEFYVTTECAEMLKNRQGLTLYNV